MRREFFERPVLEVARDLVGCIVRHGDTAGVIVETEAYHDSEPACHAYAGLTPRTATLFGPPGRAYVYCSYGVHAMLNAVSDAEGVGAAVLIRALEPLAGLDAMRARRGLDRLEDLCSGPGRLTQALGIGPDDRGASLLSPESCVRLHRGPAPSSVSAGPRVGISVATALPWRFWETDAGTVSAFRAGGKSRRGTAGQDGIL